MKPIFKKFSQWPFRISLFFLIQIQCYVFIWPIGNLVRGQTATLQTTLQLRSLNGLWVPFQNNLPLIGFEKQRRPMIDLAGIWRKQRFNANHTLTLMRRDAAVIAAMQAEGKGCTSSDYDDSGWAEMTLPNVENELYGYEQVPEYYENGVWYRKSFLVPDSLRQRNIRLVCYAVNYVADVWINGTHMGYHEGGYTPFYFDVTESLRWGENNVMVVRVDNPPWGTRNDIIPFTNADWFNYTGIIHDIFLEAVTPVHVVRADVVPLDLEGDVQITTIFQNRENTSHQCRAMVEIFRANITSANLGSEVAEDLIGAPVACEGSTEDSFQIEGGEVTAWRTTIRLKSVELWWPKSPALYVLKVSLFCEDRYVDAYATQFGVRTVRTVANKVLLNEKPIFLVGAARHEDHPLYGRSLPRDVILSDLQKLLQMNVHFLRSGHYPNHPATYLYADRLGLLVMEEIPLWWFDSKQVWDIQNNQRHLHEQMWREMVFRDYNRPSILLWGTCNECLDVPNRQIFIQRVHDELDRYYADGRLVTQSAAANRPGAHDASQAACDVAGWTSYFGVFYGSDYFNDTKNFLNQVQMHYPDKPVLITEYGYWSSENGSTDARQRDVFVNTFLALQQRAVVDRMGMLNANGFLIAATWWCAFDWYTHTQPNGYQSMGIYRMDRVNSKMVTSRLIETYAPYFQNGGTTGVEPRMRQQIPSEIKLQNYPNPFNSRTDIIFYLPCKMQVRLDIFTICGQKLMTLVDEEKREGAHKVGFSAGNLPSGVYLASMGSDGWKKTIKLILVR